MGEVAARRALDVGLAHNSALRPTEASAAFREALRLLDGDGASAEKGSSGDGAAYVRARAFLGLAVSELELDGDVRAAQRRLADAARWATKASSGAVAVAVQGQLGLVRMRSGDVRGAIEALDAARELIAEAEPVDACRILLNRGSLLLELGDVEGARVDLAESAERAAEAGDELRAFKARHNLGYAHFLAGDLPAALAAMDEAAAVRHGASEAVALLDRAHVLLEAGLVTAADARLAEAGELFAVAGLDLELAQVELARATGSLLVPDAERALRWARSARRRFAARRNASWLARAQLVESQAQLTRLRGTRRRAELERLAERALALSTPGVVTSRVFVRTALVTAAEAFVAAGRPDAAVAALARSGRGATQSVLSFEVRSRLVRAQVAIAGGDRAAARRHVRAGQALLAEHRAGLGSVEAVAAAGVHGARLTTLDVGSALADGRATAVLEAVERGRATFAGPVRVRPPQDPELRGLLSDLRRGVERRRALAEAGAAAEAERDELAQQAVRLREQVRERSWQLDEGLAPQRAPRLSRVRAALPRGTTVLDLFEHEGAVLAVVVGPREVRLERLVALEDVAGVLRRVRADLTVLARPLAPQLAAVARSSLDRGLARLDAMLLAPVAGADALHVVATGLLATVPWGALPSRSGRGTSVASRLAVGGPSDDGGPGRGETTLPTGADGQSQEAVAGRRRRVVALAGPGLVLADGEVEAVVACWPAADRVVGARATSAAATTALATADVVHLATHGYHEADNPLFSWLRMADGPLYAHELEQVRLPGSVVVLSACEVGRVTPLLGGEALGLASVLLRLGASAVVAALAPLREDLAARAMPALHSELARGADVATALARAGAVVGEPLPMSCFAAAVPDARGRTRP